MNLLDRVGLYDRSWIEIRLNTNVQYSKSIALISSDLDILLEALTLRS